MATTTSKKAASKAANKTSDGRTQNVPDSRPETEAAALGETPKDAILDRAKDAYPTPPLDTPVPSDPRLVQVPDGTATPAEANERRVEKPAPEHVEADAKTDTVHPLPDRVQALKDHNQARVDAGERVEPVGPGNSTGMTDRGAPTGDLSDHEPGTFLHGQTKEQVEATKRYSEPHELPKDVVYVTTPDGVKTHEGAARTRPTSTGGVDILAPAVDGTEAKVLKTYRAGEWSYAGLTPQP